MDEADNASVTLAGIRVEQKRGQATGHFEDDMYRIDWNGAGYAVYRKTDSVLMGTQTFANVEAAKHYLFSLYAKRVA